jgi:DNA-binding response OmpR family regulator
MQVTTVRPVVRPEGLGVRTSKTSAPRHGLPPRQSRRKVARRQARILLAEDDEDLRRAIKARLVHRGFDVTVALDGISARLNLLSHQYDAVVLDLGLPRCNGLEVLTEVAKSKKLPPVLVLTGGDDREQDLALTLGADLVLQKPSPFKEVSAALDRLLVR